MAETITLQLPEPLAQQARAVAALTHQPLEDLLVEWIGDAIAELPIESLPDDQVLALCDLQMDKAQQAQLSELLALNREGDLNPAAASQLDALMQVYRRGLVRKAKALQVAVSRGLRPALG